ncbi:hypothetical protein SLS56_007957 [Neofusicoccum ribis]|uniref:Cytochrome P450 monooxygenase n=1 Tax=Neofusicoccum ribis TaxID=45134 RepID=A0ABR3SLI0_9PEZI
MPPRFKQYNILTTHDTEEHRRFRNIFSNAFSDKSLRHQEPLIRKCVDELVVDLKRAARDSSSLQGVARLLYLQACLDETLHWHPPVPTAMPRAAPRVGNAVLGTWVPEGAWLSGTTLLIPHYAAYHSPVNFKDPVSFVQERWLPGGGYDSDRKEILQPFSHGPRNCLGKNLAYHEMRIIMANMLWHFDLELCSESNGWSDQKTYILWQKSPLWVKVKPI